MGDIWSSAAFALKVTLHSCGSARLIPSTRSRSAGRKEPYLLLCEFARKKENPSLERYIAPPSGLFVVYGPQHSDAPPTIASFSAEPPVIRGRGGSHASSCLFGRDQEPSCASHFRPCWRCCRHKEGNEVAVVTLFIPEGECPDPCRALPKPFQP